MTHRNTDDGTDMNSDTDPFERFRDHREAIEKIAASSDSDAHVSRVVLARLDGRDPNPDDLKKLTQGSDKWGRVLTNPPATSAEEQLRQTLDRFYRRLRDKMGSR